MKSLPIVQPLGQAGLETVSAGQEASGHASHRSGSGHDVAGHGDGVVDGGGVAQDGLSRRRWMQLMGASTALGAAAAGCRYEQETIRPFAVRPEGYVPGIPVKKSALCEIGGVARSLVASVFDGRPIKVDGNALHPFQGLASTSLVQALTLQLYDPDRSRDLKGRSKTGAKKSRLEKVSAEELESRLAEFLSGDSIGEDGAGLAILTEPTTSPTVARLKAAFMGKYPAASWHEYAAVNEDSVRIGLEMCFGKPLRPLYRFDQAEVVVALDSDPFGSDLNESEYARDFMKTRDVDSRKAMSRLWAIGSVMDVTAGLADERLPLASSKIEAFVAALESALEASEATGGDSDADRFLAALVSDLKSHQGQAILVLGAGHSAHLHARVWRLNAKLGALGHTADLFACEPLVGGGSQASLQALVDAIDAGSVKGLVVLGGNPVYTAPGSLSLGEKIYGLEFSAHLGQYEDETAAVCDWHINQAHCLETWTDARTPDGTWCVGQTSIVPLFGGWSVIDLLARLAGESGDSQSLVKSTAGLDQATWDKAIHDGFAAGTAATPETGLVASESLPALSADADWRSVRVPEAAAAEVVFVAGPVFDGQFANIGWLQELPGGISKVCWGNPAMMSPGTAVAWGVRQNQVIKLTVGEKSINVPVHLLPGMAPGTVAVAYGYGRTEAGRIGGSRKAATRSPSVGVDVNQIRSASTWSVAPAVVKPTNRFEEVASTQEHHYVDSLSLSVVNERVPRLAREGDLASYLAFAAEHDHGHGDHEHGDHEHGDHDHGDHEHGTEGGGVHAEGDAHGAAQPVVVGTPVALKAGGDEHHHWPVLGGHHPENFDLTPGPGYRDAPKWAMTVDLNKCTGCSACVVACQAENNIAVVGKAQVLMGRELHWIRVDRYFLPRDKSVLKESDPGQSHYENPKVVIQPVTCHHCENAPCEQVCPVAATVHSDEGLNDMVYNRCIGTRYCGNNCPFKVRKFNYHNYANGVQFIGYPEALASLDGGIRRPEGDVKLMGLAMNPEVTIRSRGVMEKCTFCVQRIQNGKIHARNEGRDFRNGEFIDGEITTACQDVCPTQAIVFGDASRKGSAVAKGFESLRSYGMLSELNLGSRLMYLARVRNPHPALTKVEAEVATAH